MSRWAKWVDWTGTVGAVAGMGFLSVVLSNVRLSSPFSISLPFSPQPKASECAGTNIGATVLLSRIIQTWSSLHSLPNSTPVSKPTFWGTVYSLALAVKYGAFALSFSASLAGLLWREDLARNGVHVRRGEFARVNAPLIMFGMGVGCTVLVGEVWVVTRGCMRCGSCRRMWRNSVG